MTLQSEGNEAPTRPEPSYATMRPLGHGWYDVWTEDGALCLGSCLKHAAALRLTRANNRRVNAEGAL